MPGLMVPGQDLSPRSGRHIHSEAVEPRSETRRPEPLVNEKNYQSPDVRSGRQKVRPSYVASPSATPTYVGVQVSFGFVRVVTPATLTRDALHHSLWICRPDGLKIPRAFSPTKLIWRFVKAIFFNCRSNNRACSPVL